MLYTIGEMAKVLGVSASTLRYYDQEGLLPFIERSSGGVRMFTDQDYEGLKVICYLKKSGLSIKEIKTFIDMVDKGDETLSDRLTLFQNRKDAVQKQLKDIMETLALLDYKCWYYEQAIKDSTEDRVRNLSIDETPKEYRAAKKTLDVIYGNDA